MECLHTLTRLVALLSLDAALALSMESGAYVKAGGRGNPPSSLELVRVTVGLNGEFVVGDGSGGGGGKECCALTTEWGRVLV